MKIVGVILKDCEGFSNSGDILNCVFLYREIFAIVVKLHLRLPYLMTTLGWQISTLSGKL